MCCVVQVEARSQKVHLLVVEEEGSEDLGRERVDIDAMIEPDASRVG